MEYLTHWGQVTHICVGYLIIIRSENGLAPTRRRAIIWTMTEYYQLETNFSEILIEIDMSSLKKMHLKMSSAKWWSFYLGFNVFKPLSTGCQNP